MAAKDRQSASELCRKRVKRRGCAVLLAFLAFPHRDLGQEIKVDAVSTFVWGEDSRFGAISSSVQDPLTGHSIHRLKYGPIEVSSRLGFESISPDEVGTYIGYNTTIVNGSDATLSVRYGGISIDGLAVSLPSATSESRKANKREHRGRANIVAPGKLQCLANGFLSRDHLFAADNVSEILTVSPKTAMTVSSVVRDPRSYPLRCSFEGCRPVGTIRYFLTVDSQDYVFVWPGRDATYCGK